MTAMLHPTPPTPTEQIFITYSLSRNAALFFFDDRCGGWSSVQRLSQSREPGRWWCGRTPGMRPMTSVTKFVQAAVVSGDNLNVMSRLPRLSRPHTCTFSYLAICSAVRPHLPAQTSKRHRAATGKANFFWRSTTADYRYHPAGIRRSIR
jgi:hypothetical protein